MSALDRLKEVVTAGRSIEQLEEGIYTALGGAPQKHQYDQGAAVYDLLVSSRLYNRIVWGTSPESHRAFARQAVQSTRSGLILDAACGSLVFTAQAYLEAERPVIACDQSLDMLRRARRRLLKLGGTTPAQVVLLQADVSDLPFRKNSFQTVLSMNVLHHVADGAGLIRGLNALLASDGQLHLTSLVKNNRLVGDGYLNLLHKQGWIVRPRTSGEVKHLLEDSLAARIDYRLDGNMAYATTAVA
jgi:ubiquinone/menaquinone biosynthesis C-methylase UbiE